MCERSMDMFVAGERGDILTVKETTHDCGSVRICFTRRVGGGGTRGGDRAGT